MNYRKLALPLAIAGVFAVGACNSTASPTPSSATQPTGSSLSSGNASSGDPLANTNPCSLITAGQASGNGWQPGTNDQPPGGRGCRWKKPDDGTTIDGYDVDVIIYDTAGLSQIGANTGTVSSYLNVGKYQSKLVQDTLDQVCIVSVGISSNSRIDVQTATNSVAQGMTESCRLAKQIAPAVVANLPAGG